jgi:cytidine deaminase
MKNYTPYSHTDEQCLVRGKSGRFYPGVRVENISYPLSITAIQAAICSCLGNGDQPEAVWTDSPEPELTEFWITSYNLNRIDHPGDHIELYRPLIGGDGDTDIKSRLKELTGSAVTIHSGFPVSALLKVDGGYIPGVNVEVHAWSLGLCAERVCIARAVAAGFSNFETIHVHAPKSEFSSPCGACRQVLSEMMPDGSVEMFHGDGTCSRHLTAHLLPFGFISDALKNK